jgi:PPIC-type PPIASE domain
VLRALHTAALWLALVAMVLLAPRPRNAEAQFSDQQYSPPASYPSSSMPGDMHFQGPTPPTAASRPASWPGAAVDSGNQTNSIPATQPANTGLQQQRPGVTVWDPRGGPTVAGGNYIPSSPPDPVGTPPATPANPYIAASPIQTPPPIAGSAPTDPRVAMIPRQESYLGPPEGYPPQSPALGAQLPAPAPSVAQSLGTDSDTATGNLQIYPTDRKDLADAKVAARIGSEIILRSDLRAVEGELIAQKKVQIPPDQMEAFRSQVDRQVLKGLIDSKLIFNDAMHTIPSANLTTMETRVNEYFDKDRLPELLKQYEVTTRQELDAKLRSYGNSLDFTRRRFFESVVISQWQKDQVKGDDEVPHAEILSYYQRNLPDYEFPAKSRWEELMVRFDRFSDKAAAYAAIAAMGNQAMRGTPFADVAKTNSQGTTAPDGGAYDWTTKGALASKTLDEAIFNLPVGVFSQILESERGFHIVRVLERKDAGRVSFVDAQVEIKKKLKEQKRKRQFDNYIQQLRQKTPVTTMFDDQPGGLDGPQAAADASPFRS